MERDPRKFQCRDGWPGAFPSSPWLALNKLNNTAYRSFHMHDRGSPKPPSHWQRRWDSAHPGAIGEKCQMIPGISPEELCCPALVLLTGMD